MLVTVRILHGFGLGMIQCLVPMYMTEVSPAHCRGAMTGMTAGGSGLGYILYVSRNEWPFCGRD